MPGFDLLQAGCYAPAVGPFVSGITTTPITGRGFLQRFTPPKAMTITKIGFVVAVAASADDPCDVAIYNADVSVLLGSSGSKSGFLNSAGAKAVPLAAGVQVIAGQVYYAALANGPVGGTAAAIASTNQDGVIGSMFGAAPPYVEHIFGNGKFPLPNPFGALATTTQGPILALIQ